MFKASCNCGNLNSAIALYRQVRAKNLVCDSCNRMQTNTSSYHFSKFGGNTEAHQIQRVQCVGMGVSNVCSVSPLAVHILQNNRPPRAATGALPMNDLVVLCKRKLDTRFTSPPYSCVLQTHIFGFAIGRSYVYQKFTPYS